MTPRDRRGFGLPAEFRPARKFCVFRSEAPPFPMLAIVALAAPSTPRLAPLNATDTLRVQLEREVQTLGRPDPPGGTAGGFLRSAKTVNGEVRSSAGGTEEAASATSKLRSAVAADVQRMLTDVERMGKTEEDEMSMLRTKAHVLQAC